MPFVIERVAGYHNFLAGRVGDAARSNRLADSGAPGTADVLEAAAEADSVDGVVAGKPRHQHRAVIGAAGGIRGAREQERLALLLRNAAAILPANQWVDFGVFVDPTIDDEQQAGLRQRGDMLVQ